LPNLRRIVTLLQRLREIPNVEAAGLITNLLQIGDNSGTLVSVIGNTPNMPRTPPVNAIRAALRELEPAAPMFEVHTVADLLSMATSAPRWGSLLLGAFAVMALLLASVGVMGVVGFVASQTHS
jgi:hypothetical protein